MRRSSGGCRRVVRTQISITKPDTLTASTTARIRNISRAERLAEAALVKRSCRVGTSDHRCGVGATVSGDDSAAMAALDSVVVHGSQTSCRPFARFQACRWRGSNDEPDGRRNAAQSIGDDTGHVHDTAKARDAACMTAARHASGWERGIGSATESKTIEPFLSAF